MSDDLDFNISSAKDNVRTLTEKMAEQVGKKEDITKNFKKLLKYKASIANYEYTGTQGDINISEYKGSDNDVSSAISQAVDKTLRNQQRFSLFVDSALLVFVTTSAAQIGIDATEAIDTKTVQPGANVLKALQALLIAVIPVAIIYDDNGTFTKFLSQFIFDPSHKIEGRLDNVLDTYISPKIRIPWKTVLVVVCCIVGLSIGIGIQKSAEKREEKLKSKLKSEGYARTDTVDVKRGSAERYSQFQLSD